MNERLETGSFRETELFYHVIFNSWPPRITCVKLRLSYETRKSFLGFFWEQSLNDRMGSRGLPIPTQHFNSWVPIEVAHSAHWDGWEHPRTGVDRGSCGLSNPGSRRSLMWTGTVLRIPLRNFAEKKQISRMWSSFSVFFFVALRFFFARTARPNVNMGLHGKTGYVPLSWWVLYSGHRNYSNGRYSPI